MPQAREEMTKRKELEPIDLSSIATYGLETRTSKVSADDFAGSIDPAGSLRDFLDSLPDILAVRSLRQLAFQIRRAKTLNKPIIWGIGGHVVKTGLGPIIIDLMENGYVTAIASNGSVLVHDVEIALVGSTSEDVDVTLGSGGFGAAQETGDIINDAAVSAVENDMGLGESLGSKLTAVDPKFKDKSLLYQTYAAGLPFTSHITIGADIGHFHPSFDGAAMGAASHHDFRLFCSIVREMNGGGVYLNVGSAVTMPEIFLKAVTVVRNLGHDLSDITTANLDFIQHYRPMTNVVRRPTADGNGRGISITGHHELILPLLAAEIACGRDQIN